MTQVQVAIVCPDDSLRMAAAQAFDEAPPEWDVSLHRTPPAGAEVLVSAGCALPDALPFDPARPSAILEAIKGRLVEGRHRVIAVVGASGGCGATSVALHLAAEASGKTCLFVPGDPRGVAYRLGLEPDSLGPDAVPVPGGFKLAGPVGAEPTRAVTALAEAFDATIVDADRSGLAGLAERSDACVLVLHPTPPSARAAADLLEAYPEQAWALVTNRIGPGGETHRAELQRLLGRRICMELPCSRGVRDAESESRLVTSWSPWRQRVRRLATALELR